MLIFKSGCFFVTLFFVFNYASTKEYPSRLPHCYGNDPKVNECLLAATDTIRKELINGIKEFGIPSIEPFIIPEVVFEQGTQALNFKMTIKNLTTHGLSSYKFEKFSLSKDGLTFTTRATFGSLNATSKCYFNGKILVVPLNGQGTLLVSIGDSIIDIIVQGDLVKNKGVDYFHVKNLTVNYKISPGTGKTRFENFEGASPEIVNALNKVIDENSDDLIQEFSATFNKFLANFAANIYTEITNRYSYDQLFPLLS